MKDRNKICANQNCKLEYVDTSKRNSSKTCSKKCAYEFGVQIRKINGSYKRTDEQNKKLSNSLKEKYENGWNPNTSDVIQKLKDRTKELWNSGVMKEKQEETCFKKYGLSHHMKSDEYKSMFSKIFSNREFSLETRHKMSLAAQKRLRSKRQILYTYANGGFREDLGRYFRSGWEANYARYLNHLGIKWEYEPKTFELKTKSYTPDFKIGNNFVEIKGKFERSFIEKFEEFQKLYPNEKVKIVGEREYRQLSKEYKHIVPYWEGK